MVMSLTAVPDAQPVHDDVVAGPWVCVAAGPGHLSSSAQRCTTDGVGGDAGPVGAEKVLHA